MDLQNFIIMAVGLAILMAGKKMQGGKLGTPLAVVGALIAVAGAALGIVKFAKSGNKAYDTENRFRYIQSRVLADKVKADCSPAKVCVIANPKSFLDGWGDPKPDQGDAFVDAVKDALGSSCEVVVVFPEYKTKRPDDPQKAENLLMNSIIYPSMPNKDYQKLCAKIKKEKPDCVINTYMFPPDASLADALAGLKGCKVAFLNTDYYQKKADELRTALSGRQADDIIGIVLQKEDFDVDQEASSNTQKSFDIRYVMLTKDNVEQGLKEAAAGKK